MNRARRTAQPRMRGLRAPSGGPARATAQTAHPLVKGCAVACAVLQGRSAAMRGPHSERPTERGAVAPGGRRAWLPPPAGTPPQPPEHPRACRPATGHRTAPDGRSRRQAHGNTCSTRHGRDRAALAPATTQLTAARSHPIGPSLDGSIQPRRSLAARPAVPRTPLGGWEPHLRRRTSGRKGADRSHGLASGGNS
jgi:hypothetical protein